MNFKNKKEMFKFIGIMIGCVSLFVLSIIGIVNIANKTHKNNVPVVLVEQENGIRLRQNKVASDTDFLSITAEITPDNAVDKTVSWSIAWGTTNSNTITDYITIEVSSDTLM